MLSIFIGYIFCKDAGANFCLHCSFTSQIWCRACHVFPVGWVYPRNYYSLLAENFLVIGQARRLLLVDIVQCWLLF